MEIHSFYIHPKKVTTIIPIYSIQKSKEDLDLVQVHIEKHFDGILPEQAKEAWMTYQWQKGGGLLGVSILNDKKKQKRRILPIWMEETLVTEDKYMNNNEKDQIIQYTVTDMGLFLSEIKEGSHTASVRFIKSSNGLNVSTQMIWDVSFQCTNKERCSLWQSITENNIQTVATNLVSYLATPHLYKYITNIKSNSIKNVNWIDLWIDFVWKNGGGLPIPSFLCLSLKDNARMYLPICLKEKLLLNYTKTSTKTSNPSNKTMDELYYCVENPGLFTYQVHTHLGRVRFQKLNNDHKDNTDGTTIQMIWEVEIRPLSGFESFVKLFTAAVVSTISRNFKSHIEHPNAIVTFNLTNVDTPQIEVPLDTWLGGVINARISDKRTWMDQSISIFQPWTWGRYQDEFDMGEVEEWTRDFLN